MDVMFFATAHQEVAESILSRSFSQQQNISNEAASDNPRQKYSDSLLMRLECEQRGQRSLITKIDAPKRKCPNERECC